MTLIVIGLGLSAPPISAATTSTYSDQATVSAPNQTLKKGCGSYRFNYTVKSQELDWMLEVWVYDAARTAQTFKLIASGEPGAPLLGRVNFALCSAAVSAAGNFTLKAQFSTIIAGRNRTKVVKPAVFKLVKPSRAPNKKKAKKK